MIWIISKAIVTSEELLQRHKFIQKITQTRVSRWSEYCCPRQYRTAKPIEYYRCTSDKGEYGVFITAHMNLEVQPILRQVLSSKRTLVVINSCAIQENTKIICTDIVTKKNPQSEIFFAKQERSDEGYLMNYMEDVGEFGFRSTVSERELFQQRQLGLVPAIRAVYEKVVIR